MHSTFESDLRDLINTYSVESASNTPDYVLAEYIVNCLEAFEHAVKTRDYRGNDENERELNNESR